MLALMIAEGFAIALLGVLVLGLLRSHAEILRALHELGASLDPDTDARRPPGPLPVSISTRQAGDATAHDIAGTSLNHELSALAIVGAPHQVLLAFLSSGCATCGTFWAAFAEADLRVPGNARLVIVVKDAGEEDLRQLRRLAPPNVTLVLSSAAWTDYAVPASPYFVYVDGASGRVIGEGAAGSWPQVAALARQAIADASGSGRPAPRCSQPASFDPDAGDRIDAELLRAGIAPGHASLYADSPQRSGSAD